MKKTKIRIQFDCNITNENVLTFMGEKNYLVNIEDFFKVLFERNFNLNQEGTEFKVEAKIEGDDFC